MQTDSVEKAAGIGAIGLWAALHGWLGWLVVLYAVCMMLDWVTGTVLAIKNGIWSSHKARQGLWHKGGSIVTNIQFAALGYHKSNLASCTFS